MLASFTKLAIAASLFPLTLGLTLNTQSSCYVDVNPASDQELYFEPDNTKPIAIYAAGFDCDTDSVAPVSIYRDRDGQILENCDSLPLDGQYHEITCPLLFRGTVAEADSPYDWYFFVTASTANVATYSYTHSQDTDTADATTVTDTTTPIVTETETSTITTTDTSTRDPVTTTKSAGICSTIRTITPYPSRTTECTTKTRTATSTVYKHKKVTKTVAAPCKTPTAVACKKIQTKMPASVKAHAAKYALSIKHHARDLVKRESIGPDGVEGDGPLTTTTTPTVTETVTADQSTTTETDTAFTGTVTTVDPTPATTTVHTCKVTKAVSYKTLKPKTITKHQIKYTTKHVTKTSTKTYTSTTKITTACGYPTQKAQH